MELPIRVLSIHVKLKGFQRKLPFNWGFWTCDGQFLCAKSSATRPQMNNFPFSYRKHTPPWRAGAASRTLSPSRPICRVPPTVGSSRRRQASAEPRNDFYVASVPQSWNWRRASGGGRWWMPQTLNMLSLLPRSSISSRIALARVVHASTAPSISVHFAFYFEFVRTRIRLIFFDAVRGGGIDARGQNLRRDRGGWSWACGLDVSRMTVS